MSDPVELEDYIISLRNSLMRAMAEGAGKSLKFSAEEITLEMAIGATKTSGAKGGVNFKVFGVGLDASAQGEAGMSHTQKLTLKLKPVLEDGKTSPLISDKIDLD